MMNEIQKIEGGTIFSVVSPSDPMGTLWVRCDRHRDFVTVVEYSVLLDYHTALRTIYDNAEKALATCPSCIEEKKPKPMCSQEEHDACGCQQ